MEKVFLAVAALVVAALVIEPIGTALSPSVVGIVVPARPSDLVQYLVGKPIDGLPNAFFGPLDEKQAASLRELAAVTLGASIGIGALSFVVLRKVLA